MRLKSTEANNLQVKEKLNPFLLKLGDVVVAEQLDDDYFLMKDCEICMGCGYRQVWHMQEKKMN